MDLSLDEIIKQNKPKQTMRGNRAGQRGGQRGQEPRSVKGGRILKRQSAPMAIPKAAFQGRNNNFVNKPWQHDMFRDNRQFQPQQAARGSYKILLSNLDFGVSDEDINELFKEFGRIVKAGVNYDRSGRSLGTAEVTYVDRNSAVAARNKYNGIPLDNKPMKITLADQNVFNKGFGDRLSAPAGGANNFGRTFAGNRQNFAVKQNFAPRGNRASFEGRQNRGNFNGKAKNGPNKNQKSVKTKEDLDAEMDAYLAKTD